MSGAGELTTRVVGALLPGAGPRFRHVLGRNYISIRSDYAGFVTGVFEPFFYLMAVGLGVATLIGDVDLGGRTVTYTAFVAPAMLAASAMNGPLIETTFNIYSKLHWQKTYDAMTATPLTPSDIALGELTFAQLRGSFYSATFLVAMTVFGLVESWWAVLALPAVTLVGLAFGAAGLVISTYFRSWQDFDLILLVQTLLFLFSATFYPLSVYPGWLQPVARLSPLYHGATLCRNLVLGSVGWADLGHVAVLVIMTGLCLRLAGRRFATILHP